MADLMNSDMQILYLTQSGLGIGDRDYYLDPASAEIKQGYLNFLIRVFGLAGVPEPEKAAANALDVETQIATASWTRVQERDMEDLQSYQYSCS